MVDRVLRRCAAVGRERSPAKGEESDFRKASPSTCSAGKNSRKSGSDSLLAPEGPHLLDNRRSSSTTSRLSPRSILRPRGACPVGIVKAVPTDKQNASLQKATEPARKVILASRELGRP